ncbi:hypothetical protein J6590_091051 [Homalodisca vitripennis]|nr:hypothetical protein J6590_091051 [Homalodisca vitripennis]
MSNWQQWNNQLIAGTKMSQIVHLAPNAALAETNVQLERLQQRMEAIRENEERDGHMTHWQAGLSRGGLAHYNNSKQSTYNIIFLIKE